MLTCPKCHYQNRDTAHFCGHCGLNLSRTLPAGTLLGGTYQVFRVIKSGGMGAVYYVEGNRQKYALKEMVNTFTTPQERQAAINRFMAEALILARLSHPLIPEIHHHFVENDRYYLVMDFVEGEDLQSIVEHDGAEGLPEAQVLDWALQLCDVLAYLHGQKTPIIFRDLKPANIMRRPDGSISLVDFGIAKRFQPIQQGTLIGTPGYAAPEQYQGLAEPRSDIFALGATLHHLLTGRDPQQHPPFTFPPLNSLKPTLDASLAVVIQKALDMTVNTRWNSIQDMKVALQGLTQQLELKPGVLLAGKYQILQRTYYGFVANELQSGAKCGVISLPTDVKKRQWALKLASLRHHTLPRMDIVTQGKETFFISHIVKVTPSPQVIVQDPAQLANVGVQMCDLLETTGSLGLGFWWQNLMQFHITLDRHGQVLIEACDYCYRTINHDDILISWLLDPSLDFSDTAEMTEIKTVIGAMLFSMGLTPSHLIFDTTPSFNRTHAEISSILREKMPNIPYHLEQAILGGIIREGKPPKPRIRSLSQLRQLLMDH